MTTRQRRNSSRRKWLLPLGAIAVMAYFGYHSFDGDYGIWSRDRMLREARALEAELAALKEQREALMRRVMLLRSDNLDPDMIDERARRNLNVVGTDELVINFAASQQSAAQ